MPGAFGQTAEFHALDGFADHVVGQGALAAGRFVGAVEVDHDDSVFRGDGCVQETGAIRAVLFPCFSRFKTYRATLRYGMACLMPGNLPLMLVLTTLASTAGQEASVSRRRMMPHG